MTRICFVSYEIAPTTKGGCGVLLSNAAHLLLSQGHEVIFLLDLPIHEFDRFQHHDRLQFPHSHQCRAYHVPSMADHQLLEREQFPSEYHWRSYRFHMACQQIVMLEKPDVIEFFDYGGAAYYALSAKVAGLHYTDTHLAIRLHGPIEVLEQFEATRPLDTELYELFQLERRALQWAETVLYPSKTYIEHVFEPYYESWLGALVESQPPLLSIPKLEYIDTDPQIILFYGRLFALKGIDRFIDAAVAFLQHADASPIPRFVAVGYDSLRAPDGSPTYEAYLRTKIPVQYQAAFEFPGQLSRPELEALLPKVCFAVFPSHTESFGYAIHELFHAGIPIIASDIPGFAGFFKHEQNALIFDNTVNDLALQMRRLWSDPDLRRRITKPTPLLDRPLGQFYDNLGHTTWMTSNELIIQAQLLICIIGDDPIAVQTTLASLQAVSSNTQIVLLQTPRDNTPSVWLFGQRLAFYTTTGEGLTPTEITTMEALLILLAGDQPDRKFLEYGVEILAHRSQIGFVASWKRIHTHASCEIDTFTFDITPELLPFTARSPFSRAIMRTASTDLLIDLLDPKAGNGAEIAYLWRLEAHGLYGLVLSTPLITQLEEEPRQIISPAILSYLLLQSGGMRWRNERLARHALAQLIPKHIPDVITFVTQPVSTIAVTTAMVAQTALIFRHLVTTLRRFVGKAVRFLRSRR